MIRDTKSVPNNFQTTHRPVRGLKIVTASEKCGGSVLNLGWWWWLWGGGVLGLQNKPENCTATLRFKIRLNMQKN